MSVSDNGETKMSKQARGSKARSSATRILINLHRDEFEEIYAREAEELGVTTRASTKQARIAKLEAKLEELKNS